MRRLLSRLVCNFCHDRKGGIATMTAIMLLPLMLTVGAAMDFARLAKGQIELQDAADAAALAGAASYNDSTQASNAVKVATNYFNSFSFSKDLVFSSSGLSITAGTGTLPSGISAYEVTVTTTASLNSTLMSLASFSIFSLTATAVAANPIVIPKFNFGGFGAQAADWNTVYMYGVLLDSSGNPEYTTLSSNLQNYYELGSNCNSSSNNYSSNSRCVGQYGASIPSNQTFPTITATQPIAFMLVNMTDGLSSTSSNGYGNNGYGSPPGDFNLFSSAYEMAGNPPSQYTNNRMFDNSGAVTNYYMISSNSTPNCSLIVEPVVPGSIPNSPPVSGTCFSATAMNSGYQYAAQSCAKMAGRTFMYWWNDEGGPSDDDDYNDSYYTVSCTTGTGAVAPANGSTSTATSGLAVILVE